MTWRTWRDWLGFGFEDVAPLSDPRNAELLHKDGIVARLQEDMSQLCEEKDILAQRLALWMRIADRDYRDQLFWKACCRETATRLSDAVGREKAHQGQIEQRTAIIDNLERTTREQAQEIDRLHDRVRVLQEAAKRRRRR